jgi:hypothetical protein
MTTFNYIEAVGEQIRRRLWITCKFGTLDSLRYTWSQYLEGVIDAAEYHQAAADALNFASLKPTPLA